MSKFKYLKIFALVISVIMLFCACDGVSQGESDDVSSSSSLNEDISSSQSIQQIPQFDGNTAYIVLNGNNPEFDASLITNKSYEKYSPLDELGRCGVAIACIGKDIMPTEDRGSIGQIKPTGWHTVKYDIVDGKYLYNRCHLIGFQLTGENANERNLITGTRYLNIEGMLPFENMVADYVKETSNHVIYRVTPVFEGNNLVASGVQIEAKSVEDNGEGICFNVYAYNCQPGIEIDYFTGDSRLSDAKPNESTSVSSHKDTGSEEETVEYVLNTSTKKFHLSSCRYADTIKETNKEITKKNRENLIDSGYSPCQKCNP